MGARYRKASIICRYLTKMPLCRHLSSHLCSSYGTRTLTAPDSRTCRLLRKPSPLTPDGLCRRFHHVLAYTRPNALQKPKDQRHESWEGETKSRGVYLSSSIFTTFSYAEKKGILQPHFFILTPFPFKRIASFWMVPELNLKRYLAS